jgi:choline-sulfatase
MGKRSLLAAALLTGGLGMGCRARPPAPPDVLLVTIDTLRADRLGCYGGAGGLSPRMDRLAAESLVFDAASCPMPLTRPSHASIVTSLYPREHGVLNNQTALGEDVLTLGEVFRAAGYRVGGFVAVTLLAADSGAAQGFETFVAPQDARTLPADAVVRAAERWLDEPPGRDRPFFLWVHLFDPHMPYAPPPPYRPPPRGPVGAALPEVSWPRLLELAGRTGGDLPREALDRALDLYGGEVAFTDHWVGELMDALDARGRRERTVVLLTADHGECFDHGVFFEHSDCLYDGATRVPLLLRYPPRIRGGRVARQVENIDIAPTLLELAGLAVPTAFHGRSLVNEGAEATAAYLDEPVYPPEAVENRTQRAARLRAVAGQPLRAIAAVQPQTGLRTREWKYLLSGAQEELYDLGADPTESVNLARSRPAVAGDLRRRLESWLAAHPRKPAGAAPISPELRETLRSLGYVQ